MWGASLIKTNDCDLAKVYHHRIQEILVALNELIPETVLKQEYNLSSYLHLSAALCRFSSLFFFPVSILYIRSKYLISVANLHLSCCQSVSGKVLFSELSDVLAQSRA